MDLEPFGYIPFSLSQSRCPIISGGDKGTNAGGKETATSTVQPEGNTGIRRHTLCSSNRKCRPNAVG